MALLLLGCGLPLTVEVVNRSRPTVCAEEDNVYVTLSSPEVRRFSVTARHPPYLATLARDSMAPDFTGCDMRGDPKVPATPRRTVLYSDPDWELVGLAYESFWRPAGVPVRVGSRVTTGLHLLQLFRTVDGVRIEVLVLYPPDGYWRAKPLPPRHLPETGYGSSFLVGPVEEAGRPLVVLTEVEFSPAAQGFIIGFGRGGTGRVAVEHASRDSLRLAVTLDRPPGTFAALRSMFVATDNNDVAEVVWQAIDGRQAGPRPIMAGLEVPARAVQFGRRTPSRHNTSAPDLAVGDFTR